MRVLIPNRKSYKFQKESYNIFRRLGKKTRYYPIQWLLNSTEIMRPFISKITIPDRGFVVPQSLVSKDEKNYTSLLKEGLYYKGDARTVKSSLPPGNNGFLVWRAGALPFILIGF